MSMYFCSKIYLIYCVQCSQIDSIGQKIVQKFAGKSSLPPSVSILESELGHVPLRERVHVVVEESAHLGVLER